MSDYRGKKVVIIGLGLTGLSCVDFFLARGVTRVSQIPGYRRRDSKNSLKR
ncbi:UDP-N-acetylmuramoylalanine--D-glutamate ligase [Tatumella ptyseos]|uniref:UDP-N-acetylmuramoylalanine--D-glutamate ligase n=1 Tax=Tatumella ptyseos TaxID=82987 RepID=A0A2X5NT32_9GAMM|nr:UDP-N-acetylmuramoylalanine--D-glutamate ligase [Tatumella ptyseos]